MDVWVGGQIKRILKSSWQLVKMGREAGCHGWAFECWPGFFFLFGFFFVFVGVLVSRRFHPPTDAPTGACVNPTDTESKRQPWIHTAAMHHVGQLAS